MRIFAHQRLPRKPISSRAARSSVATPRLNRHSHPILHLQRTIGNQAVLKMLRSRPEQPEVRLTSTAGITALPKYLSLAAVQRSPDEGGGKVVADSPYPEESNVIAYAVGAQKLGKLAEGSVFFATKDWRATAMSPNSFYVGPLFSDMGSFYYVYRFAGVDQETSTYTLTRGSYLPGPKDKDLQAGLAQVHGKTTVQVKTPGLSPVSSGSAAPKDPGAPTAT